MPTADEKKRLFGAVGDFVADRKMRDARNPVPRGYSPFDPKHEDRTDPIGIRKAQRALERAEGTRKARDRTRRA